MESINWLVIAAVLFGLFFLERRLSVRRPAISPAPRRSKSATLS